MEQENARLKKLLADAHLIGHGHRVLGQLAGPDFTSTGHDRRVGFEQAAAKAGVPCVTVTDNTFVSGREKSLQLLTCDPRPTGIFAGNDYLALNGLYPAARELGLRLGEDVSVVGFADLPNTEHASPPLTTLRQPAMEIGKQAAALVLRRLDGKVEQKPQSIELTPTLIERQSVGPAA